MKSNRNDQSTFDWDTLPGKPTDPSGLPTPPLRLRRVYLRGVGPEGARFDPLDLDFTTSAGAASRVLLSLTNTGGKSTLITLVSSLVVPAARAQVGGKNLGDYVLTGDTSHVICEWEDASTGTRTVTGTVMEWKDGRRQPGHRQRSTTGMHRAWYLFRLRSGDPGIDELPFLTAAGHRTTFDSFVGQVTTLLSARTDSPHVMARSQGKWIEALEQYTSVDPVLFGYQMRMNDSEAGAEKLLATFDSPDNVVRFFVAALNDDRELADFTKKLAPYAELAGQRPELEALAAFGALLGPLIETVADRATGADAAEQAARRARMAGGEHAAALDNRVARDRASLIELAAAQLQAAREAAIARREYGQISDIRLQLQLEETRARLDVATTAVHRAARTAETATALARAWDAVDLVLDLAEARGARDAAQAAYDAADAGLDPLRTATTEAAAALAGRLDGLVVEADEAERLADEQSQTADRKAEDAAERRTAAENRAGDALRRLNEIDAEVRTAEMAREAALAAGWLLDGERPERCARRWSDQHDSAEAEAGRQDRTATEAEGAFDGVTGEIERTDDEITGLSEDASRAQYELGTFDTDLAALTANPTVVALVGAEPRGSDQVARAAELAGAAARAADGRGAAHEQHARAAQEELAHLDETGTAPAGADTLAVLAVLTSGGFGAVTGLHWIEHNVVDAQARPAYITVHADIAGGVVVTDPARFDAAVAHLQAQEVTARTPVAVVTAPSASSTAPANATASASASVGEVPAALLVTDGRGTPRRHVVIPHRATWDREWAAASRDQLDQLARDEAAAAVTARAAAADHRAAAAACGQFTRRWQSASRDDLARRAREAAEAVTDARQRRATLITRRDSLREQAATARQRRDAARKEAATAERHQEAASDLARQSASAGVAAEGRGHAEDLRRRALREAKTASAEVEAAQRAARQSIRQAADARANRGPWLRERAELGIEVAAPDPGGNPEVVRRKWRDLLDKLSAAERGMLEADALDRAKRRVGEVSGRLRRHDAEAIRHAEVLTGTMDAASPELRTAAQRRASQDARDAESARLHALAERTSAQEAVDAAQPTKPPNYVDLSSTPEWLPSTPADIPEILNRLEIRNTELLARRDAADQAEADAKALHDLVDADVTALADIAAMWPLEKSVTGAEFARTKDAARQRMRGLLDDHRRAENAENEARKMLHDSVVDARAAAGETRWRDLGAPVAVRLRALRENELVAEAPTLARRIAAMTTSALGDLDSMNTHRSVLRDGLVSLCREQRRLLREVSRSSRLPPGLGDLSAQPAIKIRFEEAPDDVATGRLAVRIDGWARELADNPKRASSADVRARWLADAVRDTVVDRIRAGAWTIEILKPRIDGRVMYCPPDRIPHEFSGGQVLTLAVLIYCALSGVRSAHRVGGARPPGALILDNPFGAASAEALIEMQHRLAAHTGLQLVCATGLNDAGVDAAFTGPGSVIVKLRNDGDLRRNLSFLRLRAAVVDGVDIATAITAGRDPADSRNWVDGTSYEVRR
ncbi:hypothetical protein FMEAI12_4530021 [Parafrankia sp. Ea1.12]|uniref:hypothetical protein n=1 Tax=Parafrankia sp. Ea1.12 TaxID=573499 RepID=UPI000DA439AC|nr:hypothetical protein [Parafrankia sp. Ea1.12]SQD98132.1 hypothetical protein FMEAI12_4530021 [Parafrankia sp. Ea1.12]